MANVNENTALDVLVQQMKVIAKNETDNASYTKEYIGIVEAILGACTYQIRYNNASYKVTTKKNLNLSVMDSVHMIVPNNNLKNTYMLEELVGEGGGTVITSGVASVDGMTGNVVLSGIYAKKANTYTKSEVDTLIDGKVVDVPTKVSELENDSGYINDEELDEAFTTKLQGYSKFDGDYNSLTNKPSIPSKMSQLTNDTGYITADSIPSDIVDKTYLESNYYNKSYIDNLDVGTGGATSGTNDEFIFDCGTFSDLGTESSVEMVMNCGTF